MLDPWVRKIPWRKEWQPTLVFLPGEFHGQRSLEGYSPWGHKESDLVSLNLSLYIYLYLINLAKTKAMLEVPAADCRGRGIC